jgi:hypothetical protein
MKTIIHVNQHAVRRNTKNSEKEPVITCKTYKSNDYAHEVEIISDGKVVAKVVYRPDKPLSCGARVWIETEEEVRLIKKLEYNTDMTDIKIDKEIAPPPADIYFNGEYFGTVDNDYQFLDLRLQIKNREAEGFSVFQDGAHYEITKNGMLPIWPKGLFDFIDDQLREILGF